MQHKIKISDQASACTQMEDKEWQYQKNSVAGGWVVFVNIQDFSPVDRSDRAEAVIA